MHGLETITHVGQRARNDDAHRVVDERLFDLVVDEARKDPFAVVWSGHFRRAIGEKKRLSSAGAEHALRGPKRRLSGILKSTRTQGENQSSPTRITSCCATTYASHSS